MNTLLFYLGKPFGCECYLWVFQAFGFSVNYIGARKEEQLEVVFLFFRLTINMKKP